MAVLKLKAIGRKMTGLDFGHAFAGQIERKVAKHAEKHPDESNLVEIDLNAKGLTDEGLCEVLDTVLTVLLNFNNFHLEEFHLSKNGLTTGILPFLSKVIQQSSFDLRALDLSHNDIHVVTEEQARDWEEFLDSFRVCRVMRRLDLSGNDFSKSLGMEILSRVYFSHPYIDPNELESGAPINDDMASTREFRGGKLIATTNSSTMNPSEDPFHGSSAFDESLSKGVILKRRQGLRSVPYIILRNVGMTDAGALWLSGILEHHYWPQFLMTTLKEGSHAAKLKGEDDSTHTFGVVYVDNPNITATGLKALESAEQARVGLAGISEMSGSVKDEYEDPNDFSTLSDERKQVGSVQLEIALNTFLAKGQMDRLRKKLQRTTIEAVGVNGVQLWAAALELLNLTRAIVPPTVLHRPVAATVASMPNSAPNEASVKTLVEAPIIEQSTNIPPVSNAADFPPLQPALPAFPHKTLRIIATNEGPATVFEASTPPKPSRGKGLAPRSSPAKAEPLFASSPPPYNPPTKVSLITQGLRKMAMAAKADYIPPIDQMLRRSETWPMGMHEHLWIRVLCQIARDGGVLSARQIDAVIKYARDRHTLRIEMETTGRADSVQIWGVLDRMGCLEYEVEM
ncbi:hypothetical protein FKW77_007847 [Venturia effusa]|uniref:Uncharacterized protein n=1 Tax=Venturia effusa TaxID=50376 RepID=A0A517LHM9_9PEZI|nr:hypothetical protein FKW77_007847 [Venturia effusa]